MNGLSLLIRQTTICPRCKADASVGTVPLVSSIRQCRECLHIHRMGASA